MSVVGVGYSVKVTTWVYLMAAVCWTNVLASDGDLLGQQDHTRGAKTVADKLASGIAGRSLDKGAVEPFTIHPHYDPSVDLLSSQQQRVLKTVLLDSSIAWLQDALRARPMATSIKIERSCFRGRYLENGVSYCIGTCAPVTKCGPVTVPEDHLLACRRCSRPGVRCSESAGRETTGVNGSHFLLYVSALNELHCRRGSMYMGINLVKAAHCMQEESFDRPVAGYINFCPNALSTDPANFSIHQSAVLHELLHALVFSQELFPYFHDEQGYPRSRRTADGSLIRHPQTGRVQVDPNTVRTVWRGTWTTLTPMERTVTMIVTPHVKREVKEHFDCPSLEGAELENQGGEGVAGVHWENRVFGEELMTGMLSSSPVLSKITLALLHDSGWYLPDYAYAGQLLWGRDKGCMFVQDSCGGWMAHSEATRQSSAPFCDGLDYRKGRTGCTNGRTAVGPCLIRNYTIPLPTEYQYLSRRRGGTQILADFCPLFGTWQYGEYRVGSSCLNEDHAPLAGENFALEEYGEGSRCFEQATPITREGLLDLSTTNDPFSKVDGKVGGVCYKFECSARRVLVKIGDQEIRCGKEGRKQYFSYTRGGVIYKGSIVCPAYSDVCQAYDCINRCSDHGTCHDGRCHCHLGYHGDDCSRTFAQQLLTCDDVTCHNNGTCLSSEETGFSCQCPTGLIGAFCEQEIIPDPCLNKDCHGNGICTRTNGGRMAQCNCYHGYDGRECGLYKDLCSADGRPCLNEGTCTVNTTQCVCTSQYWGEQCENRVNFCEPISPCSTGHLCTHYNATQNYSCYCPEGYTGPNCSELITDYCADSPCLNNATCVSTLTDYQCLCRRGYKGGRCKLRENPCRRSPCTPGQGRCRKDDNGPWGTVYCECKNGYSGEFCELLT